MSEIIFRTNGEERFPIPYTITPLIGIQTPKTKLEVKMTEERDWRHYVTLISLEIEDTIPNPSEIETLDAVKLLVRENNALRMALGLPTYGQLTAQEEKERYGETS